MPKKTRGAREVANIYFRVCEKKWKYTRHNIVNYWESGPRNNGYINNANKRYVSFCFVRFCESSFLGEIVPV